MDFYPNYGYLNSGGSKSNLDKSLVCFMIRFQKLAVHDKGQ